MFGFKDYHVIILDHIKLIRVGLQFQHQVASHAMVIRYVKMTWSETISPTSRRSVNFSPYLTFIDFSSDIINDSSEDMSEQPVCPFSGVRIQATIQVILTDRLRI